MSYNSNIFNNVFRYIRFKIISLIQNQNYMGHTVTKQNKVNICIIEDFRNQNLVICNVII